MTLPPSSDFRWHSPYALVVLGCVASRFKQACDVIMNQVCAQGQSPDQETCGAKAEASARGPDRGAAEHAGPTSHLPDSERLMRVSRASAGDIEAKATTRR